MERAGVQVETGRNQGLRSSSSGVLQRQCACGTHTMGGGQCADCQKNTMAVGGRPLQTKLRINEPGDVYEQEADRVADFIMRMPEPKAEHHAPPTEKTSVLSLPRGCTSILETDYQRQVVDEPEEPTEGLIQTKRLAPPVVPPITPITHLVRRQVAELDEDEEDPFVQAKLVGAHASEVSSGLEARLQTAQGTGLPIACSDRGFFESRFGLDFSQIAVHTDAAADALSRDLDARAFTVGHHIFFRQGEYAPRSSSGRELMAHELTHVVQQRSSPPREAIQAYATPELIQRQPKDKKTWVPFKIHIDRRMTQEEYKAAVMHQVFGAVMEGLKWDNLEDEYLPENSPYPIWVEPQLLKAQRGGASKERGISVGEGGDITGATERAKTFHAGPETDVKSALMKEIDRRYYETIGEKTETKIKPGEKGKAELWRTIRDEVLFQHEYIANLPPKVKELIKVSIKGRNLPPADYDKLFAIAKKIEKMPAGQVSDYASKVTGTTADLDEFELSLDKYIAEMAERKKKSAEREKIHTKLLGLEEIYKKYRLYLTLLKSGAGLAIAGRYGGGAGGGIVTAREAMKVRAEVETQLQAHGFAGVTEFEEFIEKFERAFEAGAANIAKDVLGKYAGKLFKEQERYENPVEISALHKSLGGVRTKQAELESGEQEVQSAIRAFPPAGGGGSIFTDRLNKATQKRDTAQKELGAEVSSLGKTSPVFEEEGLPDDKKINKPALAKASEADLHGLVKAQIARRMKDIEEAKAQIDDKPELIYKMEKLLPHFYAQLGVQPGSIHDMIIQDKMKSDVIMKVAKGIATAIVAIALAVVTFGTATPAIIAAGAAIAGAGLGVYQAYESYQEYTAEKNLADVGLAKDPSVVWLVIAVAGAALDMAAAVKAVSVLGKAAKALDAGGDLAEFTKVVRALEKEKEITSEIARAAEKAAAARKGFTEASAELTKIMAGKVYSFPGPLADPEVYKAVVKMARQAIKAKVYDVQKFIEEIKLARVSAKLGDLSPQELVKAKQAWEEAKALEAAEEATRARLASQVSDVAKLDALIAKAGDAGKLERLLKVFPEAELETIFVQLKDTGRLATMLDDIGAETGANMIRQWMAKGKYSKMNEFMERLVGGVGKELAETTALGGKTVIIDSQTAIALSKDAKGLSLQAGEQLMVRYVKSLPPGTELRVGNVTIGEVGLEVVNVKGLPLAVTRDSAAYKKVLSELERLNLGGGKGAADRALVADSFFAKTEPGVVPQFATADKNVFNKLATEAGIDLKRMGGKKLSELYPGGFDVQIAGQTLHVKPIEP